MKNQKTFDGLMAALRLWKSRYHSWSSISSFRYDKDQWFRKYILGEKDPPSLEMLFGNVVGERLAKDPEYLPTVPRLPVFEQEFKASISGIKLIGFLDAFRPSPCAMGEYKTATSITKWTQKSAQDHGQLKFYKLLIWINTGVRPEDCACELTWIPVRKSGNLSTGFFMELADRDPVTFRVRHTSADVLEFANYIKSTFAEMESYAEQRIRRMAQVIPSGK